MEGTPAHLPFTFVCFGGHACKSPGHAGKNFVVDSYIKFTLKSHNYHKTWLNFQKCLILERQSESTHVCRTLLTVTHSNNSTQTFAPPLPVPVAVLNCFT